jgi:hypothetical protein
MRVMMVLFCVVLNFVVAGGSYAESSEAQPKKFSAGIEVSALGVYSGGAYLGYVRDEDFAIELYRESAPLSGSSPADDRGYIAGVKFRHFIAGNLNVSWSPYYRLVDSYGESLDRHVGISAAIGHRFRTENAYFGVEWLGGGTDRKIVSGTITGEESGFIILLRLAFGTYI